MVMTACPECSHAVSSAAAACPECGHPLIDAWRAKRIGLIVAGVCLALSAIALFIVRQLHRS